MHIEELIKGLTEIFAQEGNFEIHDIYCEGEEGINLCTFVSADDFKKLYTFGLDKERGYSKKEMVYRLPGTLEEDEEEE